jgi:hypothetical protein
MNAGSRPAETGRVRGVGRRRLRRTLLVGIALLYVLSVPWYRESGAELRLILGLPDWVAIALVCYVGVALLNAWAWLVTEVSDDDAGPRAGT